MNLSDKKLVFVTGKGGVGKSVCAAAIAWREARKGRKVCLFELGSQSFYEAFFQTRGIGYEPSEVVPDVHISLLSPESALREYVLHFVRVPKLYDVLFHNKVIKSFLNATPALPEISILGKLTSEIRGIFTTFSWWIVSAQATLWLFCELPRDSRELSEPVLFTSSLIKLTWSFTTQPKLILFW